MVKEDKSLQNFIDHGATELVPLRRFRNWLVELRSTPEARDWRRRNGTVYLNAEGEFGRGPFTLETRREILRRLLALEMETGFQLITQDELKMIDQMWENEGDLSRRALVETYYEVRGERRRGSGGGPRDRGSGGEQKLKVLILHPHSRYDRYLPDIPAAGRMELVFTDREGPEERWLAAGGDADALVAGPVTPVTAEMIARMPNLRLIHSDGIGVDRIDVEAARRRGIYVCNCAGCNAGPVAELAVTLMSMLLHRTLWGHRMVRSGHQHEAVNILAADPPEDLSTSRVGLVGFGAIGQATAARLRANGSQVFYYAQHRRDPETEARFGAAYLPLEELAETCDIVSLHLPATAESTHLIDRAFFQRMKPGGYLVNTARGAVIDDGALCEAIRSGRLAGAALDAYAPEPVPADHPLVKLAAEFPDRLVLCPHQGGIVQAAFREAARMVFADIEQLMDGKRPDRIVNGL